MKKVGTTFMNIKHITSTATAVVMIDHAKFIYLVANTNSKKNESEGNVIMNILTASVWIKIVSFVSIYTKLKAKAEVRGNAAINIAKV